MDSIFVLVQENGHSASLLEANHLVRFDAQDAGWIIGERFPLPTLNRSTLEGAQALMHRILALLGDHRVLAGSQISGKLYQLLTARGVRIYEAEGDPTCFLQDITALETAEAESGVWDGHAPEDMQSYPGTTCLPDTSAPQGRSASKREVHAPFKQTAPGVYTLDLATALRQNPDSSSKKLLLPFLRETEFTTLALHCDHLPPWLPDLLEAQGMQMDPTPDQAGKSRVIIRPKKERAT